MSKLNDFMPEVMRLLTEGEKVEALKILREKWSDLKSDEAVQAMRTIRQLMRLNNLGEFRLEDMENLPPR